MNIFTKLTGMRKKLTRLSNDEPVTKLALAVIILLDIFILSIIFGGLDDHTAQLTSPSEYFPHQCRMALINQDWSSDNQLGRLQGMVLSNYNNWSYQHQNPFEKSRIEKMHPSCADFYQHVRKIAEDHELKAVFIKRQKAESRKRKLVKAFDKENESYDTALLECIAGQPDSKLKSIAATQKQRSKEIDRLSGEIKGFNSTINQAPSVKELWNLIPTNDEAQREQLIDDLNRYEKLYLFKELLWQLLFLLPLLAIFCIWNSRSVKKEHSIQGLISAHLMVVAAIPILIKLIQVVLELIPMHFFKDLFELMERLHMVALWHYAVIILTIAIALICVFIIQKKFFSKVKLNEKRLSKGACYACGKRLPGGKASACPFCGAKQRRTCSKCGAETYATAVYCDHCGHQEQPDL